MKICHSLPVLHITFKSSKCSKMLYIENQKGAITVYNVCGTNALLVLNETLIVAQH